MNVHKFLDDPAVRLSGLIPSSVVIWDWLDAFLSIGPKVLMFAYLGLLVYEQFHKVNERRKERKLANKDK